MSWNKIASDILKVDMPIDNWNLSIPKNSFKIKIPGIVKITLNLLENAFNNGDNKIIVIYPENTYLSLLTVILHTTISIISGDMKTDNFLDSLQPGQKLKENNKIHAFIGKEIINNKEMFCLKLADGTIRKLPANMMSSFYKTNTKRPLSNIPSKNIKTDIIHSSYESLKNNLTYLNKSVIYSSTFSKIREAIENIKFDNYSFTDILLFKRIKEDNSIDVINTGKPDGIPAVLINNKDNLYQLLSHVTDKTKCIFIDYDDSIINNQLSFLDTLTEKNIPVIILSDTINSFNLDNLEYRGFKTLRWDNESLISEITNDKSDSIINPIIMNCCNKIMHFELCDNQEITLIDNTLRKIKKQIITVNENLNDIYWQIREMSLFLMRNTIKISSMIQKQKTEQIDIIKNKLKNETYNISKENMLELLNVIENIHSMLTNDEFQFTKALKSEELVKNSSYNDIILVIPDNDDKSKYIDYWNNKILMTGIEKNINIMAAQEYYNCSLLHAEVIICGWLEKNIMRHIVFSYNVSKATVLLCKKEEYWSMSHLSE